MRNFGQHVDQQQDERGAKPGFASGQITSAPLNKKRDRYATLVENLHESFVTRFRYVQLKRPHITFLVDPFNAETDSSTRSSQMRLRLSWR
ncbi:hypothetical protein PAMP_022967 [Pampus punctatissimus]